MSRRTKNMQEVDEVPKKRRRTTRISTSESEDENDESLESSNKENESDNEELYYAGNRELICGRIRKMHLKNFMCHGNLVMEFNPKINLLVGNNGSGKSAIITALAIGLGADARTTNRGKSTKGLIKNDESSCSIEIHLTNTGIDAYDPEVYGETIIVYRKINASGGGEYRLKSESGATISTKKNELKRILLHMNIQPNNPIVILNQDNARAFLKDSDGKQLFKLFMQATQLQTVLDKLNICYNIYLHAKTQLERHNRGLDIQKSQLEKHQAELEEMKGLEVLKQKLKRFKCDRAWFDIGEQEKVKRIKNQELAKIHEETQKLLGLISNKDNLDKQVNDALAQFTGQIQHKQESLGDLQGEINSIRGKIEEFNSKIIEQRAIVQRVEDHKRRLNQEIQTIEVSLKDVCDMESVRQLRQKNATSLAKLIEREDELKSLIENASRDLDMLRQTNLKHEEKQESIAQNRSIIQQKIRNLENQCARYNNSRSDPLAAYDPNMSNFVRRIEQEVKRGGFSKPPRGPIGQFISVPDKKWRMAIESICGGLLQAFIVNTDKDRIKLDGIRTREFSSMYQFPIITQKFVETVYDINEYRTPNVSRPNDSIEAPNVMDVIQVNDPVVMNCLIDQLGIENILVCANDRTASYLTKNQQSVPRNLKKIICVAPFSEYYPAPSYRSYSLREQPCRYIQAKVERQLKSAIANEQQNLKPLEQEIKLVRQQLQSTQTALRDRTNELQQYEKSLRETRVKIDELKNYEYPKEDDGEFLRQELEQLKANVAQADSTRGEESEKLIEIEKNYKQFQVTLDILKKKRQKIENEITAIQRQSDEERSRLYDIASKVNEAKAKSKSLLEDTKKARLEYEAISNKIDKMIEEAEKLGQRREISLDRHSLTRKIVEIDHKLRETATPTMSIPEMEELVQLKKSQYENNCEIRDSFESTLKLLCESRIQRYTYLKHLKQYFAYRVRSKFASVLKVRNMNGTINFDYKNRELELSIAPRGDKEKTNTKSLSGGERSYSTIAFLIALWSCCDSPFYFLDEYDVFTDQVNRFVMTKLLIHEALSKNDQFAFLTPQDMSSIEANEDLTIHRFADPIRGNMGTSANDSEY
uniref:CSON007859 protein n=1 Tax=Culicoides sonorensis TaxID=179676 RepID=A0A336LYR3_CULSO